MTAGVGGGYERVPTEDPLNEETETFSHYDMTCCLTRIIANGLIVGTGMVMSNFFNHPVGSEECHISKISIGFNVASLAVSSVNLAAAACNVCCNKKANRSIELIHAIAAITFIFVSLCAPLSDVLTCNGS